MKGFNALSYTWASTFPDTQILCDNRIVTVSGNCELALRRFLKRKRGDPPLLPLWVDSICIHQADVDERNAQVAMMGDIYSKASYVLVWLRPEFEGSDSSFKHALKRFRGSRQMRQMGSWRLRQSYLPRKLRSRYAKSLEGKAQSIYNYIAVSNS